MTEDTSIIININFVFVVQDPYDDEDDISTHPFVPRWGTNLLKVVADCDHPV